MNWIPPMEPIISDEVKIGSEFVHEIKWDGIRGLVYLQENNFKLFTKKGNDRTDFYPELNTLYKELGLNNVVLDGELVVFDNRGLPSFQDVLVRETVRNKRNLQYYLNNYPVKYVIFDILQYQDKLLIKEALTERKKLLSQLINPIISKSHIIHLSEVFSDGKELYEKMKLNNMEGIVSKRASSTYIGGKKHDAWFKTKFTKKMLCAVGGIQWKDNKPNSLVLGITKDQEKLSFVGKASLGLKESDLQLLKQYSSELIQDECPFEDTSITDIDKTGTNLTWIKPFLTCWISFLELSNDGHFRHPKIIGFAALPMEEANGKVLTE